MNFLTGGLLLASPGGQQLVSQVLLALFITQEASGAESQAVLARSAVLSRCIILLTSQTCVPHFNLPRSSWPPYGTCVPAVRQRARSHPAPPTALTPRPVLSVSLFAPLLHGFNSDSINPPCDFVLWPKMQSAHAKDGKFCPVLIIN